MKSFLKFSVMALLFAGMLLVQSVGAKDHDAVLIVSSLKDVQTDVGKVIEKINPDLRMFLDMPLGQASLMGLDQTKPIQVIVDLKEDSTYAIAAFCAIKNQKLFDGFVASQKEQNPDLDISSRDGWAIFLSNATWDEPIPSAEPEKLLTIKGKPEVLLPLIQLGMAEVDTMDPAAVQSFMKRADQIESTEITLDVSEDGSVTYTHTVVPKADSELAATSLASEKMSKTALSSFCNSKAPVFFQVLCKLAPNVKDTLVEGLNRDEVPPVVRDVFTKIFDQDRLDLAGSFYATKNGIVGYYAVGIKNGTKLVDYLTDAIEKDEMEGVTSAGKYGTSISLFKIEVDAATSLALGIHDQYLFVTAATDGSDSVKLLKQVLKKSKMKSSEVTENCTIHYNMNFIQSVVPDGVELKGNVDVHGNAADGKSYVVTTLDADFFETIGKLIAGIGAGDDEDLFGDMENFDDDDEADDEADDDDDDTMKRQPTSSRTSMPLPMSTQKTKSAPAGSVE